MSRVLFKIKIIQLDRKIEWLEVISEFYCVFFFRIFANLAVFPVHLLRHVQQIRTHHGFPKNKSNFYIKKCVATCRLPSKLKWKVFLSGHVELLSTRKFNVEIRSSDWSNLTQICMVGKLSQLQTFFLSAFLQKRDILNFNRNVNGEL